jgi:ribose 5-phosphate isomerase B
MVTFVRKILTMVDFYNPIAIASDHAGYCLKEYLKEKLLDDGLVFNDFGAFSQESTDYPDMVHPLAKAVDENKFSGGIIICGSANGVAMVANKYRNVRAAVCWNEEITQLSRQHNKANIIALPARYLKKEEALKMVRVFFSTGFEGGRHERRVNKISEVL